MIKDQNKSKSYSCNSLLKGCLTIPDETLGILDTPSRQELEC